MESLVVSEIKTMLPYFMKHKNVWASYDVDADALYLHYKKPNHADSSELTDDNIIVRYEKEEIVGITILDASKR